MYVLNFSCDRQDVINYEKGNKMQRLAKSPRVLRCASGYVKLFPLIPLKTITLTASLLFLTFGKLESHNECKTLENPLSEVGSSLRPPKLSEI